MKRWLLRYRVTISNLAVCGGLLYLTIPRLDEFAQSFGALRHAEPLWVCFGIVVYFMGMPLMALQLTAIALKPLTFFITYKVQMAALFANRIIPSNMGLLILNTYYLKKYGHSNTETASVIGISAITSAIAFGTLIIIGLIAGNEAALVEAVPISLPRWGVPALLLAGGLVTVLVVLVPRLRQKIQQPMQETLRQITTYKHRPHDLVIAIFGNGLATLTSVVTLYACAHSLGAPISIPLALMTYVLGNTLGGLVPTPGGLGGVEAGLYAGLVLGGVSGGTALSIVLLYRLITYWLALCVGFVFFVLLRKDVLANFSLSARSTKPD